MILKFLMIIRTTKVLKCYHHRMGKNIIVSYEEGKEEGEEGKKEQEE